MLGRFASYCFRTEAVCSGWDWAGVSAARQGVGTLSDMLRAGPSKTTGFSMVTEQMTAWDEISFAE